MAQLSSSKVALGENTRPHGDDEAKPNKGTFAPVFCLYSKKSVESPTETAWRDSAGSADPLVDLETLLWCSQVFAYSDITSQACQRGMFASCRQVKLMRASQYTCSGRLYPGAALICIQLLAVWKFLQYKPCKERFPSHIQSLLHAGAF